MFCSFHRRKEACPRRTRTRTRTRNRASFHLIPPPDIIAVDQHLPANVAGNNIDIMSPVLRLLFDIRHSHAADQISPDPG